MPEPPTTTPARDYDLEERFSGHALMARSLAYLFAAGATIALFAAVVARSADEAFHLGPAEIAHTGAAAGVVLLLVGGWQRMPGWSFHLILAMGSGLITSAVAFSGEVSSTYVVFYVLIALYASYFFTRVQALAHILVATGAYGGLIIGIGLVGEAPLARWLTTLGTLVVAGTLVRLLKERVERLIDKLENAARTDVLTGLFNRRGFEEQFELELERSRRSNRPMALVVGDLDFFKGLNDRFGHKAGDQALERVSELLQKGKRRIDTAARIGGEEFAVIVPEAGEHDAYILAERLRLKLSASAQGSAANTTISLGIAIFPRDGATTESLLIHADQALYAAKKLGRDRTVLYSPEVASVLAGAPERRTDRDDGYLSTVLSLAEALDVRDNGTSMHCETVGRYCELIARELQLPAEVVRRVRMGGMLHDVGTIGISEKVLKKTGPLADDDWEEMRKHPEVGARLLDGASAADIRGWILSHHERPDGLGYPRGLSGDDIPLEARILAAADAYEGMTSERSFRQRMSPEEARRELMEGAGSQFDAQVVKAFTRVLQRLDKTPASA